MNYASNLTVVKRFTVLSLMITALFFSSCDGDRFQICLKDEGADVTREFDLDQLSGIDIHIEADVTLINAFDGQFIEVTGPANVLDRLETDSDVALGIWEMNIDGCRRGSALKVTAAIEDLEFLGIRGSGSYTTEETLETISDDMEIDVSGSGDIVLELANTDEIEVKISGKSDMELFGETENFHVEIRGTGDIQAHNLISQNALIDINGNGRVDVHAQNDLDIEISGTGNVCFIGDASVSSDIFGTGDVEDCN